MRPIEPKKRAQDACASDSAPIRVAAAAAAGFA
jgi:hypothetical protein